MKLGLKVYNTNKPYIEHAKMLYREQVIDFIEVFLVADSVKEFLPQWIETGVPLSFHAPHSMAGLNPSFPDHFEQNKSRFEEIASARELYDPLYLVFHPGVNGDLDESIKQFNWMLEEHPALRGKALIENKPKKGYSGEDCLGAYPHEMSRILDATGMGFLLDFGHASCAAASAGKDFRELINQFLALSPSAFHLSDGHVDSVDDEHLHIGEGDYDLAWFKSLIPEGRTVALECMKDSKVSLDDFRIDVKKFQCLGK